MKIDEQAMIVLEQCRVDGNNLFLPPKQLDRKLYEQVNKALVAMGGKWNRTAKAHIFKNDPTDLLEQSIETGEVLDVIKELQYFPTPKPIVQLMIEKANLKRGMKVLEPSAGEGAIADELRVCGCVVTVCELHQPFREKLQAEGYKVLEEPDFLKVDSDPVFDAVIANPPFSRQQDISHCSHMLDMLKPNGILVSVMSAGVKFRDNRKTNEFRVKLENQCTSYEIESLPDNSFKESGTAVNTVLLVAKKK